MTRSPRWPDSLNVPSVPGSSKSGARPPLGGEGVDRVAHRLEVVTADEDDAASHALVEDPERRLRQAGRPLLAVHVIVALEEALVEARTVEGQPAEDPVEAVGRARRDLPGPSPGPPDADVDQRVP